MPARSTTLRAISGFLGIDDARVTDGTVTFNGRRIENRPPNEITRLGIVLVPERDKVFPNLTVAENLAAPVRAVRAANAAPAKISSISSFPQLADLRNRAAGLLSGGERQMLAIASALVCRPEVLLVDELSLGLAPVDRRRSDRAIGRRFGKSLALTIVIVEQNAAVALNVADYGYVLENGRCVLDGDSARLRAHGDIQEFYLGQSERSRAPQLSRGETISPEPKVVWLSLRSRICGCTSAALSCSTTYRSRSSAGELLALIGPNGAGKTSVLNCISGIYRGDGAIRFRGRDIGGLPPHQIARLGIARTFQHGELFPQMSVIDNLLTGRHARIRTNSLAEMLFLPRVRRQEVEHRAAVEAIIDFVELERYRHAPVGSLPFGTQKLVGFARALALEPAVLLLDEPSAGLNRDEREDLARFILRIKHELGIAMIWIEHDMQMVADLADRIHVLELRPHAGRRPARIGPHRPECAGRLPRHRAVREKRQ